MSQENDNDASLSPMRVAMIQLHEVYLEMQRAGFSKREALKLVTAVLVDGMSDND